LRELEQFALLDPLTQLGNRRFIEMNLQTRLDELCRYGFPFGVLFVDIDRFKLVNDTYGHDCGDAVLRMVANTLAGSSRLSDCFGRWGGEEFIGIICNVDQDGLLAAAERLRLLVKSACLDYAGQTVGVTVSIGAALARPGDAMEDLVRRVDQLMYQGKKQGRDCVSSESSPQPGPLL
jgi:diguanylate cyclase (GGDEF)-like protein